MTVCKQLQKLVMATTCQDYLLIKRLHMAHVD